MSSRKVKVIIGILAVAVLVMLAAAHSRKSNYSIVIPKVLTYPTTTLTFVSKPAILGSPSVAADRVQVKFDNPNWAATVSEAHLVTKAGGTYFKSFVSTLPRSHSAGASSKGDLCAGLGCESAGRYCRRRSCGSRTYHTDHAWRRPGGFAGYR